MNENQAFCKGSVVKEKMREMQIKGALGYAEVVEVLSDFCLSYRA